MRINFNELERDTQMTKREIAEAIGVDVATVYRWIAGATRPQYDHLEKLEALKQRKGA